MLSLKFTPNTHTHTGNDLSFFSFLVLCRVLLCPPPRHLSLSSCKYRHLSSSSSFFHEQKKIVDNSFLYFLSFIKTKKKVSLSCTSKFEHDVMIWHENEAMIFAFPPSLFLSRLHIYTGFIQLPF